MNLLSGLEKFGLSANSDLDITQDDPSQKRKAQMKRNSDEKEVIESDFVLDKMVTCPVCDKKFHTLTVKTGKAKRLEPDFDLRPNYECVDTIKYDACACPHCGYAAMNRDFVHLSTAQMKWIRQGVSENFKPIPDEIKETYTYDESVDRFKLALISAMTKKAKVSEKAYICLKIAWLRREQYKQLPDSTPDLLKRKKEIKAEWDGFYRQAYDGFNKASATEMPPYCGMDNNTLEFILANMAMNFQEYNVASKLVSRLLTSPNSNARIKDKCIDLKEDILKELKSRKENEQ